MAEKKKTSIGGQALLEGIMMRGPQRTAMAVRNPQGEIVLEEFPTQVSTRAKILKAPFVRGIFNMYDSLKQGYRCLMRSAQLAGLEEEEKNEKSNKIVSALIMPLAVVLAVALAVGLFMYLPSFLYKLLSGVLPALKGLRWPRACSRACSASSSSWAMSTPFPL